MPENGMGQYKSDYRSYWRAECISGKSKTCGVRAGTDYGIAAISDNNYSVFYVIEDMDVIVTRVLYSDVDISRRLLEDNGHIQ